jgi:acetylornithine/succinyldiaminopimelate/putrescine aminotransferase
MPESRQQPAGPDELLRLKREYLIPCVYHFYERPPQIVAADGCWLIDHQGRRYLDCYTGVTVMSAGHGNPAIIEPAIEQIRTLQHTTTIYLTEPILRLAEKLASIAPGDLRRSFFCASGSEAVEGALLLACLHTGRSHIIAMRNGLHGRTRWAMNVTGLDMWRTDPNPLDTVQHVSFGDVEALERLLHDKAGQVAAVIAEPIQGNGGICIPPADYWPTVRELCTRHNVLLILDEIQTGIGRTGKWFACEHWDVVPDVMTVSKALGNGFPISAFITTDAIAASYTRPGASTSGGNPVSAAAALATLAYHEQHALADRAAETGRWFLDQLTELADGTDRLARPCGRGLMIGVDVVTAAGDPDPPALDALLERLKDEGFLCGKTGADRNVLTFMPPLTIERDPLRPLFPALGNAIAELKRNV